MRKPRSFVFLAALLASLSLGAAPACSPVEQEDAESVEGANSASELAKAIRLARLAESIEPVFKSVKNDPTEVGAIVRKTLDDADATRIANLPADAPANVVRSKIVALGKNKLTRQAMVRSSIAAIQRRSNQLKAALRKSTSFRRGLENEKDVFDEVVLGMGPQAVAYAQATTDLAPAKRILMVDSGKKPGGTFANVNEAFALNSTNRQNTGQRARPGQGDLNFIQDIWGMPDFQGQKWVPAGGLADLSAVGTDISSANTLLETSVVRILDREIESATDTVTKLEWPARYQIIMTDQATGSTLRVYTNKVIVASGIGKPTIPIKDAATLKLIEDEAALVANNPDAVPGIQTFTQLINRIGGSDTPYRWAVNKDVVVVGGGDSGKVINEFLFRLGPQGAYGLDTAQVGNVRRVFWFGVDFDTCKRYIAQSRGRYAALSSALSNGTLIPVPANIAAITRDDLGRFTIKAASRQQPPPVAGVNPLLDVRGNGVAYVDANGAPRYVKEFDPNGRASAIENVPPVDNIILATGFRSEAEDVLGTLIEAAPAGEGRLAKLLEDVVGRPEGFDNDVAIASRLANPSGGRPHGVYFVGPSNEVRGGLPKPNELARVNANTVSLFANVSRTRELARLNAREPAIGLGRLDDAIERIQNLTRNSSPRYPGQETPLARLNDSAPVPALSPIADLELKSLFGKLLQRFDAPEGTTLTTTVTQRDGKLFVTIPELDLASEVALVSAMRQEVPQIADMLTAYFGAGSTVKKLEIVIPTGSGGTELDEGLIDVIRRNTL